MKLPLPFCTYIYSLTGYNISCTLAEGKGRLAAVRIISHIFKFIACGELHYIVYTQDTYRPGET